MDKKILLNHGYPQIYIILEIIKKLETEGFDNDNFKALDKAKKDLGMLKSSMAIRKIRF